MSIKSQNISQITMDILIRCQPHAREQNLNQITKCRADVPEWVQT